MKAPPYTAKDLTRFSFAPSLVSDGGKKSCAMISEKNPNIAKSYHSRTFPSVPARVCMRDGILGVSSCIAARSGERICEL